MGSEEIEKILIDKVNYSIESVLPEALNDVRLEDAFKSPIYDEQGYAPCLPAIIDYNICHNLPDDVKAISYLSATLTSELYSKLDNKFTTTKKIRDFFFSQAICNCL